MVDVFQRVGQHPAADVVQLTPTLRTLHFADNPLRSDLFVASGEARTLGSYGLRLKGDLFSVSIAAKQHGCLSVCKHNGNHYFPIQMRRLKAPVCID